ncbi:MAG: hypothetical protein HUJ61_05280 [Bacilli bacterium]|nr:hypothetical protein [Bacilli bacterium]
MSEEFEVYEFRYIDKETKQGFCVYARTIETADQIITIENENNVYHYIKPRFRKFKRKYITEQPPYDLELEQLEVVTARRNKRLNH